MTEKSRTVLIALGVSLLVVVLAPLLLCLGTMAGMGDVSDMSSVMDGTGRMMSGGPMIAGGIVFLTILITGIVSLVLGLRRS